MSNRPLRLNFPEFRFRTNIKDEKEVIWDELRHCWLIVTPEEWVRQHLLKYLILCCGANAGMIVQECPVKLNGTDQRADIVLYDREKHPLLLAECKAPYVEIDRSVIAQAVRYNYVLDAEYIILTNGIKHLIYRHTDRGYLPMKKFPYLLGR